MTTSLKFIWRKNSMDEKKKKFAADRWHCIPAYEVIGMDENFTLSKESEEWLKEVEKEMDEEIEELKKMRDAKNKK